MEDTNKLKSLGSFVFFEALEPENGSSLKIIHKEPFGRGRVVGVQEEYSNLKTGTNIIYLTDKASPLGLGYPKNVYVIRYDDIISICL